MLGTGETSAGIRFSLGQCRNTGESPEKNKKNKSFEIMTFEERQEKLDLLSIEERRLMRDSPTISNLKYNKDHVFFIATGERKRRNHLNL